LLIPTFVSYRSEERRTSIRGLQTRLGCVTRSSAVAERSCDMLRVIEYFAKSLKFIRNDTIDRVCMCITYKSLLVFHRMSVSFTVYEIFSVK